MQWIVEPSLALVYYLDVPPEELEFVTFISPWFVILKVQQTGLSGIILLQ